jgi:PAB-dependent poly(A)-specific ribonuclease subunit 3
VIVVFHQADASGRPIMDLGHVVTALNKLDTRDEEKIVLASRDGKSIMVVSFTDIAACLENAYAELCASSVPTVKYNQQESDVMHSSQHYHR